MVLPVLLQRRSFWCDSRTFPELEVTFATAALAHYNDFGHALIYVGSFVVEVLEMDFATSHLLQVIDLPR